MRAPGLVSVLLTMVLSTAPRAASASDPCPRSNRASGRICGSRAVLDRCHRLRHDPHRLFERPSRLRPASRSGLALGRLGRPLDRVRARRRAHRRERRSAGTAVDGRLEFRVDGWSRQNCGGSGCGLRMSARWSRRPTRRPWTRPGGPSSATRTIATTLSLPVHFVAGAPIESQFVLDYGTGPGAGDEQAESVGPGR